MGVVKKMAFNDPNVTSAEYLEITLDNGARLVSNLCYDTTYPNGFMDVYYTKNPKEEMPATLIVIHGGGYIWGDKSSGDHNVYQLGRVYLKTNDLKYDKEKVTLSNVIDHVTEEFPPSFISDGNSGSFLNRHLQ